MSRRSPPAVPPSLQGIYLWGALAVLDGLVGAAGNAQDGVVLAAFAAALHAVNADLAVIL